MLRTLNNHLALRLGTLLLAILFCLMALGLWMKNVANEKERSSRLSDAREHYAVVLADLDRRWGREAFNLKARIESQNLLDGSKTHVDELLTFLISQGSSIEFPSLRIEKTNGDVIAAYDYASHVSPKVKFVPSQNTAWAYHPSDDTLYLVIRQFIWLGKENGYLLLFKPMDHALLTQTTYPGTRLSLWWKGQAVASSDGEDGQRLTGLRFPKPENGEASVVLTWSGPESENAPKLLIEVLSEELIGMASIAKPVLLAFVVILLALAVSFFTLWQGATQQLDALLQARQRIDSLHTLDERTLKALRVAQTGPVEGLRTLADATEQAVRHSDPLASRRHNPET